MKTQLNQLNWLKIFIAIIWAFIVSILLLLTGCKPIEYIPIEKEIVKTITITERDTLIKVEEDQASLQALFFCDSLNQILIEQINIKNSYRTSVDISVNENNGKTQLLVDCKSDSLELEIKLRDKLIEDIQNSKEVVVIPASLNSYQKTMIALGWLAVVIVGLRLFWKVYKKFK